MTPNVKSKYLNMNLCWRECGVLEEDHSHIRHKILMFWKMKR